MIENSGINNNKSEFDLYNFLLLLWKYKVLISLIPAIVLVISLFLFKNNTSHLTYKNEIFIDYQTMSGVSQYADTSAPDIMTLLVQTCREKHNFFKFIEDNPQKEIIKNMINGKRLKCKYDSQENRIYIIVENYLVNDQTQIEDLAYFPFIFFNFIEENINEKITRYYESKIEFRKYSIEKKLNDTKTQINIQRSTIKDEYKSAISQLKMHLKIAEHNQIYEPTEEAPGVSLEKADNSTLFLNGTNVLNMFIASFDEVYQKETFDSSELRFLKEQMQKHEAEKKGLIESDFFQLKPFKNLNVLIFQKDNEYLSISSPQNLMPIFLFLAAFGLLVLFIVLFEGFKLRFSK